MKEPFEIKGRGDFELKPRICFRGYTVAEVTGAFGTPSPRRHSTSSEIQLGGGSGFAVVLARREGVYGVGECVAQTIDVMMHSDI